MTQEVSRSDRLLRFSRYLRRLPPRMVIGKLIQMAKQRFLIWRTFRREPVGAPHGAAVGPGLRGFAESFALQGIRVATNSKKSLESGTFRSGDRVFEFGSLEAIRSGRILSESPLDVRLEHDLAFLTFAMPLATHEPEALHAVATICRNMEHEVSKASDLRKFEWSPIALAFRTMSLISSLQLIDPRVSDSNDEDLAAIRRHIEICGSLLERQVERYLGYNHAVFTESALVAYRLHRGDLRRARSSAIRSLSVIDRCTLPDGTWSERSPAYHAHMLLMLKALRSTGLLPSPQDANARDLEDHMCEALDTLVHPDGDIAVFNDAAVHDAPAPELLGWRTENARSRNSVLPDAGFVRASRGLISTLMDAGPMGPEDVVGHGHADFLAVETAIAGHRFIVDPGVASISGGPLRAWTRSAEIHNGPVFVGYEPAEFFGAWRVGWSGAASIDHVDVNNYGEVEIARASCNGWARWGGHVQRTLTVCEEFTQLCDKWTGMETTPRQTSFLISEDWSPDLTSHDRIEFTHCSGVKAQLILEGGADIKLTSDSYFPSGPASSKPAHRITCLPSGDSITIRIV
ncbi:MAG: heparinase II/III-family protein, partial [Burkholderiales bacterium]